jgi:hypothetical protein
MLSVDSPGQEVSAIISMKYRWDVPGFISVIVASLSGHWRFNCNSLEVIILGRRAWYSWQLSRVVSISPGHCESTSKLEGMENCRGRPFHLFTPSDIHFHLLCEDVVLRACPRPGTPHLLPRDRPKRYFNLTISLFALFFSSSLSSSQHNHPLPLPPHDLPSQAFDRLHLTLVYPSSISSSTPSNPNPHVHHQDACLHSHRWPHCPLWRGSGLGSLCQHRR